MPPTLRVGGQAARTSTRSSTPFIWVSDELVNSAFRRFAAGTSCRIPCRYGSNVPGPLEARRRLERRRMNNLSIAGDPSSQLPPPSPLPTRQKLIWLPQLWRRDTDPQWKYEPPIAPESLPLPPWLEKAAHDVMDNESLDLAKTHDAHQKATRHTPDIQAEPRKATMWAQRSASLHTKVSEQLSEFDKSLEEAIALASLVSVDSIYDCIQASRVSVEHLDRVVARITRLWSVTWDAHPHKADETAQIQAYRAVWEWLQRQQPSRSLPGQEKLFRYLFDHISARLPTTTSCRLLLDMLEQAPSYRQLRPGDWTGNALLHLVRQRNSSDEKAQHTFDKLLLVMNAFPPTTAHSWLRATIASISKRRHQHASYFGRKIFLHAVIKLRELVHLCRHCENAMLISIDSLIRGLVRPEDVDDHLALLPDAEICTILEDQWLPHLTRLTQLRETQQTHLGRAPADVPNACFQHLAPYFELVWRIKDDLGLYKNGIRTILSLLLKQDRPEDMAYLVERIHRSLTFSLPIPQEPLKIWMDQYSLAYPKTAVRLSKLFVNPEFEIRDVLIDLIRSPDVSTGALDFFTWREVCKDRVAYMRSIGLRANEMSWRRCLSPSFTRILHAFAIAYAREPRLGCYSRFNRIYRLYRHLKLQRAEIHPILPKLMMLTGVILPLIEGRSVNGKRISFAIRVEHVLSPEMPIKQDLMQLGRLSPAARSQRVGNWADAMFGREWRRWVGMQAGEKVLEKTAGSECEDINRYTV